VLLAVLGAWATACGGKLELDDAGTVDAAPAADAHVDATPPLDASAPDVAAVETGGPFTPASLANLVLWLDASHLVKTDTSGRVLGWGDQSSFKNDAAASISGAPTLLQTGIHGLASIHFDPSATAPLYMLIADSPSLRWGAGDFLVAVLARYTNNPANGYTTGAASFFFKSTFSGSSGSGVSLWGNVPLSNGSVADGLLMLEDAKTYAVDKTGYHDGVARLFVARRQAQTMDLRVNGATTATQAEPSSVDVSATGTPVIIGALAQTYYRIFGDVSEIVALKGATVPSDLAALESYFETKYGL